LLYVTFLQPTISTLFPTRRSSDLTLQYLDKTNRPAELIDRVERYTRENLLWRENEEAVQYSQVVELDLGSVRPTISGPSRPQDKILLSEAKLRIKDILEDRYARQYVEHGDRALNRWANEGGNVEPAEVVVQERSRMRTVSVTMDGETFDLSDGDVVIAAITSCTNTSNPDVMIGAGLMAKKAVEKGLNVRPWVKTSLAPGSKVVTDYLEEAGLLEA